MATQLKAVPDLAKIEHGVPIPKSNTGRKYPFSDMQVGDSFFTEVAPAKENSIANSIRTSARPHAPKKFTTRRVDGGLRTWRFA